MACRIRISITTTDSMNSSINSSASKLFFCDEFIPSSDFFDAYEQLLTDTFKERSETGLFPKFDLDNPIEPDTKPEDTKS